MYRIMLLLAVVALIAGCKTSEPKEIQDTSGVDEAALNATAPVSLEAEPSEQPQAVAPSPAAVAASSSASRTATSVRIRTAASGCLAQAGGSRGGGSRAPSRGPGSTGQPDRFDIVGQKGNVAIEQAFTHGCCLDARTTARLDGHTLEVITELTGKSCRCLCASTLRSSVALPPGTYTVKIVHKVGGNEKERAVREVVVK